MLPKCNANHANLWTTLCVFTRHGKKIASSRHKYALWRVLRKKSKFEPLRKQRIACYRSKLRLQKRKDALTSKLHKCKERLNDLRDSELEDLAKEAELPEAQIALLTKCIAACSAGLWLLQSNTSAVFSVGRRLRAPSRSLNA